MASQQGNHIKMKNDARFFDFLKLAPRGGKPRKRGMTTIGDEGELVAWLRSMLDIWATARTASSSCRRC
jgi:hypothetical protein